jgi:hypothetical protein
VTVHSTGFGWWRRLVDRYDWQMFRRVTRVSLRGPQYTSDLLPHLGKLSDLRELELVDTSIPAGDVAAWRGKHPHVAVSASRPRTGL